MVLLLLNLLIAGILTGLIWTIQLVHYPMLARSEEAVAAATYREHGRRIVWLVAPLMVLELAVSALLWLAGPAEWWRIAQFGLVGVIWIDTATVQVPLHRQLCVAHDPEAASRLVRSNWIRTGAWTLRLCLLAGICLKSLSAS